MTLRPKRRLITLLYLSFTYQAIMDVFGVALPIFALTLSASPFEIGLLSSSRGIMYSIFPFLVGYLSHRFKKGGMLAASLGVDLSVALLFFFSRTPLELIVFRFLEGASMAVFWPTLEPLIVEVDDSPLPQRLRGFNVSWALGQMAGPLLGGGLISLFGVRAPFLGVAVIAAVDLLLISKYPVQGNREMEWGKPSLKLGGQSIKYVSTAVLLGAVMSAFFAFFPAFSVQLGISALEIGFMLFAFGVSRIILFYKAPSMRIGLEWRVALASLGFLLIYLGKRVFLYIGASIIAAAASLIYAYVIEHMLGAKRDRGWRAGVFEGSLGVGFILGPFFAGLAAEASFSYPFLLMALTGLAFITILKISET